MTTVIEILQKRGFIEDITSEEIYELSKKPLKVYIGFDPTSDSLHLGNFIPMMGLAWFQRYGHTPVAIIGGATGMIGDPSGKSKERNLLDQVTIEHNLKGIRKNLETILDFNHPTAKAMILNNYDWFRNVNYIEFLRDVGKHFRMGPMLARDSVKSRLNSEEGISYTEFSYQLLQAYDFFYLNEHHGVTVQMGGSDQWGNITAGTDLIRKLKGEPAFGVTFPLLTRSDGKKFGKSEEGAVWLSPDKLSPYEFYQYLFRLPDADVIKMMKVLTFMDLEEISAYEQMMSTSQYVPNTAQKRLAEEVTRIVHGQNALDAALRATLAAAPGANTKLDASVLDDISADIPSKQLNHEEVLGVKLVDLFVTSQFITSKSEARRLIRNGGAYLNNQKIDDEGKIIQLDDLIDGRMIVLGAGKKNKLLVRVKPIE